MCVYTPPFVCALFLVYLCAQLLNRQLKQQPVTSVQMDIVLWGMALSGGNSQQNAEAVGKLFEEYSAAGLQHTRDSYHAVLQACVQAKQVRVCRRVCKHTHTHTHTLA